MRENKARSEAAKKGWATRKARHKAEGMKGKTDVFVVLDLGKTLHRRIIEESYKENIPLNDYVLKVLENRHEAKEPTLEDLVKAAHKAGVDVKVNIDESKEMNEPLPTYRSEEGKKYVFEEHEAMVIYPDVVFNNVSREYNNFLNGIRMQSASAALNEDARVRVRLKLINMGDFKGWCELVSIKYQRWMDVSMDALVDSVYKGQVDAALRIKQIEKDTEGKQSSRINSKDICTVVRFKFITDKEREEEGWKVIG